MRGNFWSHHDGWDITIPTNTDVMQQLLFRAVKPFQFVTKSDIQIEIKDEQEWRKWFDSLIAELNINNKDNYTKLSNMDRDHLRAIVSPFIIYPYYSEARNKMFGILSEYVPMHQDCLSVVLQYIYIDNTIYEYYYNKYKDNVLIKAMELSFYMKLMPNVAKNKFFEKHIFSKRFDDPLVLKLYLKYFEERAIDGTLDLNFWRKLLVKYKDDIRLTNKGYYDLLAQVMVQICYWQKYKLDFRKFMDLLSISPLINESDIHRILNYYDSDDDTLLMRAIRMFGTRKRTVKHEMVIMKCLINHKQVDIINTFQTSSNAFHLAVCHDKSSICNMLLNTHKIPIDVMCNVINGFVVGQGVKWRKNMAKLGTYLTYIYQHKRLNKRKKKLVKETRQKIRRYLRRYSHRH